MADKLVTLPTPEGAFARRFRDMGDGTLAEVVANTANVATSTSVAMWNAAVVAAGGNSGTAVAGSFRNWIICGNASAATTLTVQVSHDNVTWYTTTVTVTLGATGDFFFDCRPLFGATYVRLSSSGVATITARLIGSY